mmetsp:Transcript_18566/g.57861  ORF Transcript_18566/g.57861 Transcript_18566/m.57861 type:complete len:208 (+) Transcript_18566:754-1377(+)
MAAHRALCALFQSGGHPCEKPGGRACGLPADACRDAPFGLGRALPVGLGRGQRRALVRRDPRPAVRATRLDGINFGQAAATDGRVRAARRAVALRADHPGAPQRADPREPRGVAARVVLFAGQGGRRREAPPDAPPPSRADGWRPAAAARRLALARRERRRAAKGQESRLVLLKQHAAKSDAIRQATPLQRGRPAGVTDALRGRRSP